MENLNLQGDTGYVTKLVTYSFDEEIKKRYASEVEESQPEETPTEE